MTAIVRETETQHVLLVKCQRNDESRVCVTAKCQNDESTNKAMLFDCEY